MTVSTRPMNPFPGLRPFRSDEDYLFFGREEQTLELLKRLGSHRFVAVVGTSGSGKSSLVRCGLLSELQGGRMLQAGASWEIAVTHPGGNPLALLTEALLDADLYDRKQENTRENLLATLSRSHFGLVEAVKQAGLSEGTNFLLVVDQFEEIFRFHEAGQEQQEAANEFVSLLLEAVAQTETPIYVVLTMRSDFIGECGQFEGLAEMVNRGEFLIPRLTRDQYKRVIEGPIKVAGGQIAPRLLQRLLNDLGQQADQLPCLQHALMRTWTFWSERGDSEALDLDDYHRVGRMSDALSLHADEVYETLADDRRRELCRGIFQALTVQESENRGIRRPQRLLSLCQILDVSAAELRPIIDAYRHQGVTFLTPSPEVELTDRTIIDISHESLMRVWVRLRRWVEEEAQAAGIYRRLSESAALHEQRKAGLYRDPELGIALAWRDERQPNQAWAERYHPGFAGTMAFLEASRQAAIADEQAREAARQRELEQAQQLAEARQQRLQQQQRAARRLRAMIGGLAVVAAIAGIACIAALVANNRANRLAERAQQSAGEANRQRETAQNALTEVAAQKVKVEGERNRAEVNLKKAVVAEQAALAAEQRSREFRYATDMQLAANLIGDEQANAVQVLARLAAHDPAANDELKGKEDLRGFEWHYLKRLLESRGTVFSGFENPVIDCTLTADGELVTLDEDAQLQRRDAVSRRETRPALDLKKGRSIGAKALSLDGKRVALTLGEEVLLVDAASGAETLRLQTARAGRGLIFSPDGKLLVTIGTQILWWDATTGMPIASTESRLSDTGPISISRDGLTVAVGGQANRSAYSVFRMNPQTREVVVLQDKISANFGGTRAYVLSPDGQSLIITQMFDGQIRLYDTTTGRPISQNATEHAASISAVGFSESGDAMVTASLDGAIKIWKDFRSLKSAETALLGHTKEVTRVFFAANGKQLVSCSLDQTTRLWDLTKKSPSLHEALEGVSCLRGQFSPDGLLVATTDSSFQLRVKDAATGRVVRVLPRSDDMSAGSLAVMSADSIAFSPDNRLLAAGFGGARDVSFVELWDLDRGQRLARLPGSTAIPNFNTDDTNGIVSGLAFSPDGKHLVASFGSLVSLAAGKGRNLPLAVYDVASRQVIRWLEGHKSYCTSVTFSRDGSKMASGSYDGTAIIWDAKTWTPLHVLDNPDPSTDVGMQRVFDVAFSPAGDLLAMASYEGNVIIWDAATGEQLQTLSGHASGVSAVRFSPDGRTLASGSFDHTIRLWSVATWQEIARLDPGAGFVPRGVAFSPDGSRLLGLGGSAFLWSTRPEDASQTEQTARQLAELLGSQADFQSRIRMLSENLRLHEALEILARENAENEKVQAALAAARANWHASRQEWPQAVEAFDRLKEISPQSPAEWLRTPGLLRMATALLHQGRAADAAGFLSGGVKRRQEDGLPPAVERAGLGFAFSTTDGDLRITELLAGYPGSHGGLRAGDVVVKVDDVELNIESIPKVLEKFTGEAGAKVRLTVKHSGSEQMEVVELTRLEHVSDAATGALVHALRTAINERLALAPLDAGLLELRAELVGQWQGFAAQAADYSAAIEVLTKLPSEIAAQDLARLYRRRGDAYVGQKNWKLAAEDFARAADGATGDDESLASEALAQAELLLAIETLSPTSEQAGTQWRYTTDRPADQWNQPGFDDSKWASGAGPFGTAGTTASRTTWSTPDIWLRRTFESATEITDKTLFLRINCDDTFQVFLNGKPIGSRETWTEGKFVILQLEPEMAKLLTPGKNTLAVHARNLVSGAYLDVGLLATAARPGTLDQLTAAVSLANSWVKLAAAHRLTGDQEAIDRLVARRPKEAGPIGDLFTRGTDQEKDWPRAIALYSLGITSEATDAELLARRARAYEAVKNWEAAADDWNRAAKDGPEGMKLLAEFRRRLAEADQRELAAAQRQEPRQRLDAALLADPGNTPAVHALAQLLSEVSDSQWTILKPGQARSQGGATMTVLEDNSVLVSGVNPDRDVYEVEAEVPAAGLTAIRLEGLTHDSLPNKGHARVANAVLTEFEAEVSASGEPPAWRPIKFSRAWADHAQPGARIENAIDGRPETAWTTEGHIRRENRTAIFVAESPFGTAVGNRIRVRLRHESREWAKHQFGRFRLAVTSHQEPAAETIPDVRTRLALAYALAGDTASAAEWAGRALDQAKTHEAKAAISEKMEGFQDVLAELIKLRPGDAQLKFAAARNHAQRGAQALDQNHAADALVELKQARELFTQVLGQTPQWKVVEPTEMKSAGGALLTRQEDGSILVSGTNPDRDSYTLVARPALAQVTAIRLEALPDPSLPGGGPGRSGNGNFHVNEVRVSSGGVPAALTSVVVAHDEIQTFRMLIDGRIDRHNGWSNYPRTGQKNAAAITTDLKRSPDDELKFELYCSRGRFAQHNLGRFRLSVTGDPNALAGEQLRWGLKEQELANLDVTIAKAHAQQGETSDAAAALAQALDQVESPEARTKIVDHFRGDDAALAALAKLRPEDLQLQFSLARSLAQRGRDSLSQQHRDEALSALDQARQAYTRLLADHPQSQWSVLKPVEMKSAGGTELTLQADGSVLASGARPSQEVYTLTFAELPAAIRGLRLEVLPDDSLPDGGPGRAFNGNFVLTEIEAQLRPAGAGKEQILQLKNSFATHAQSSQDNRFDRYPIAAATDKNQSDQNGWAILPKVGQAHSAVFELDGQVEAAAGSTLAVSLIQNFTGHQIGRFRISVTTDPRAAQVAQLHQDLSDSGLAELELALASADARQDRIENAAAGFGRALDLATDLKAAVKVIQEASTHDAVLEKLAQQRTADARFHNALARFHFTSGDSRRSQEAAATARALYEQKLQAEPRNSLLAGELADLLLEVTPDQWTLLKPTGMKSEGGATLALQPDGSILVSGTNPDRDTYTITAVAGLERIGTIRLEALPDPSLPQNGPGRFSGNGNFTLNEIGVSAQGTAAPLASIAATYSERPGFVKIIDGQIDTNHWSVYPRGGQSHSVLIATDIAQAKDQELTFQLSCSRSEWPQHNLGRFRLSVSADPSAIEGERSRLEALRITAPWPRLGAAYHGIGDKPHSLDAFVRALELAPNDAAKAEVARSAAAFDDILAKLAEQSPGASFLRLGQAKYLAPQRIAEDRAQEALNAIAQAREAFPQDMDLLVWKAEAHMKLRQWSTAIDDYAQIIERQSDQVKRREAQRARAEAQLRLGQSDQGAEVFTQEMLLFPSWDSFRNAYAAQLLAGNPDIAKGAAARLYGRLASAEPDAYWSGWLVRASTAVPGMVTAANRERLLTAAAKAGGDWTSPMTAAVHYRLGNLKEAEPLLTSAAGRPEFLCLAAMLASDRGDTSSARRFLKQADDWFRRQREQDLSSKVPAAQGWQEWGARLALWREATRKLAGPRIAELDVLLAKEPENAAALQERSQLLAAAGLFGEALTDLNKTGKMTETSPELLGLRGRILASLERNEEALADLNRAVELATPSALVYAARGGILLKQGKVEEARSDLAKSLELEPTEAAARSLADLLLSEKQNSNGWTALKPVEAKSELGATLSILPDHSILASGANPRKDRYHVVATVPADINVAAVRLEALTHPSLPGNGPGRSSPAGTFAQISWNVTATSPDGKELVKFEFDDAIADHQLSSYPITPGGHWNIGGGPGRNCTAVWSASTPVALAVGATLSFEMQCHNNSDAGENLGHFRLSVSGDSQAFERDRQRFAALKFADPWARLAAAYRLMGQEEELEKLVSRRPEMVVDLGDEFARQGDWEQAVVYFSRAITPETKDRSLLASRAEAYGKLGQWEPAKADWQRVFDLQPDDGGLRERYVASLTAGAQWDDVAREYSRQLDALPEGRLSHTPRGRLIRTIIRRGDPAFERLMAVRPEDTLLRAHLARNFVVRSDWESAIREYAKAIEIAPPAEEGYEYAAALLLADKRTEYDRFMKQFVDQSGGTADPYLAYALARAAAISATPATPPEKLTAWADLAIGEERRPWYLHAAGLAYLRAGNRDEALKLLQESAATTWHPELNQLALALYYAQGKDIPKARDYLSQAEKWLGGLEPQDGYYPVQDTDWLETHLLLREVKALIDRDAAATPAQPKPGSKSP